MATNVSLRLWEEYPVETKNLILVTKLSDLGAPTSNKTLLGFYMNIRHRTKHHPVIPAYYDIKVFYRNSKNNGWINIFTAYENIDNPGNKYLESIFDLPYTGINKFLRNINLSLLLLISTH